MTRPSAVSLIDVVPPPRALRVLGAVSVLLRRWMVAVLLVVLGVSLLFHEQAAALKSLQFFRIPGTTSYFDFPTLALTLLMFTASVQCRFQDFEHLLDSPKAALAGLILHYVAVPALAVAASSLAVGVFNSAAASQIRLGLIFIALMPVALTAAVWVRANRGNVTLLLALVVLTTAAAVMTVPLYVRFIPGMGDSEVVIPVSEMIKQLVFSITIPLLSGMVVQHLWPAMVTRWQPAFSLLGMFALFASSGSNVGAAAPMIASQSSLLAAAAMVTVFVAGIGYALGLLLARRLYLRREDALCLTFASGMKNPAAAMVIGAATFPTMPLVPVPAAIYSIVQHLIAGFLTKSFEDADSKLLGRAMGVSMRDLDRHLEGEFGTSGRRDPGLALLMFRLPGESRAKLPTELLQKIGRVVRANDYVCSLPPDGFAVVLAQPGSAGIARVVDKIIGVVATSGVPGWSDLRLGIAESQSLPTLAAAELVHAAFADAAKRARNSLPRKPWEEQSSCTRSPSFLETESVPR